MGIETSRGRCISTRSHNSGKFSFLNLVQPARLKAERSLLLSKRLAQDVRQGLHAQKVMESYQNWFGEAPELSILRILGLFDRTAEESMNNTKSKQIRKKLAKPLIIRRLKELGYVHTVRSARNFCN
jgi:hypothetical protein